MTKSEPQASVNQSAQTPISEALEKNQEAQQAVQKAADDLAVVHAVLETSASGGVPPDDARKAVAETANVEQRLTQTAEKLDQVNESLQRQMDKPGA